MPSAGRPFTTDLVTALVAGGVVIAPISLHTGVSSLEAGEPPVAERYLVPPATARLVNLTKRSGGRVIAVGTTVTRALETVADDRGQVNAGAGWTIWCSIPAGRPGSVDGLVTGWHAPGASHLCCSRRLPVPNWLPRPIARPCAWAISGTSSVTARCCWPAGDRARRKSAGPGPCAVAGGPSGDAMAATALSAGRVRAAHRLQRGWCGHSGELGRALRCCHVAPADQPGDGWLQPAAGGQAASVDSGNKDPHGRWSKGVRDVFRPGRGLGTSHYRPVSDLRDKRTELPRLRWLHPEPDGHAYSGTAPGFRSRRAPSCGELCP